MDTGSPATYGGGWRVAVEQVGDDSVLAVWRRDPNTPSAVLHPELDGLPFHSEDAARRFLADIGFTEDLPALAGATA